MAFEPIEQLKLAYTDKYVRVADDRPELARFGDAVGRVKTINMSGRALVEFENYLNNPAWHDLPLAALRVVEKPPEPAPAAKKPAAEKAPAKPAAKQPAGGKSAADVIAAARGGAKKPGDAAAGCIDVVRQRGPPCGVRKLAQYPVWLVQQQHSGHRLSS